MICLETCAWWILQSHFLSGRAPISLEVSQHPEELLVTLGKEQTYHFILPRRHLAALKVPKKNYGDPGNTPPYFMETGFQQSHFIIY